MNKKFNVLISQNLIIECESEKDIQKLLDENINITMIKEIRPEPTNPLEIALKNYEEKTNKQQILLTQIDELLEKCNIIVKNTRIILENNNNYIKVISILKKDMPRELYNIIYRKGMILNKMAFILNKSGELKIILDEFCAKTAIYISEQSYLSNNNLTIIDLLKTKKELETFLNYVTIDNLVAEYENQIAFSLKQKTDRI